MTRAMIFALVRHALTAAGTALVFKGVISGAELEAVVGAVVNIMAIGFSAYDKSGAK